MNYQPETRSWEPPTAGNQASPSASTYSSASAAARVEERPELAVGAAFAGGFVLALILKRLAR